MLLSREEVLHGMMSSHLLLPLGSNSSIRQAK